MSHFSITVRVPANIALKDVPAEVGRMLRPYDETDASGREFMRFEDKTDELKDEWEANENGEQKETLDAYLDSQYEAHEVNGELRRGYWTNPNAKWDWYQIGGRWAGHWPVKVGANDVPANCVDVVRIKDIEQAIADAKTNDEVQKFLVDYDQFHKTGAAPPGDHPFHGIRHTALNLGLLRCLDADELPVNAVETCRLEPWPKERWKKNNKGELVPRYDVVAPLPGDEKFVEFARNQFNKLRTYARLDKDGWVEPGKMGWFGFTDATVENREVYSKDFAEWLKSGNQGDWVVCVDCHI